MHILQELEEALWPPPSFEIVATLADGHHALMA